MTIVAASSVPSPTSTRTGLSILPNSPTVGVITLVATVTGTSNTLPLTGTVTFLDGNTPLQTVPVDATGHASFTTSALGPGTHVIIAVYSGDPNYVGSPSATVNLDINNNLPGPTINSVERFGFHAWPTTLVLHFNEALDPARAQDVANYRIVGPDGRTVAIASAVYDSAAHTVTLAPRRRLDLHRIYRLTVVGTGPRGIADGAGNLLDGGRTGRPGSDYVTSVKAANLVLGSTIPGGPRRLAQLRRTVARIVAHQSAARGAHSSLFHVPGATTAQFDRGIRRD